MCPLMMSPYSIDLYLMSLYIYSIYCIAGKFGEGKVWRINISANKLFIVSTNFDGFSLANYGRFTKFAKLSCHKVYDYTQLVVDCSDCIAKQ